MLRYDLSRGLASSYQAEPPAFTSMSSASGQEGAVSSFHAAMTCIDIPPSASSIEDTGYRQRCRRFQIHFHAARGIELLAFILDTQGFIQ
jgi:hypothetical protein